MGEEQPNANATWRNHLKPPEQFSGNSDEWPVWSKRYTRYYRATKLDRESDEHQIDALMLLLGDNAENILLTFKYAAGESSDKYKDVFDKFNQYYGSKQNKVFHRRRFNRRVQEEGESIRDFITDLHALAKPCGYKDLEEELIRDRILAGMSNQALSEALQMDPNVTLEQVVQKASMSEEVKKQQHVVRDQVGKVDAIKNFKKTPYNPVQKSSPFPGNKTCGRCGKSPAHAYKQCPAIKSTCKSCGKVGHWGNVCHSKGKQRTLREINLPAVDNITSKPWQVNIKLNNLNIAWKLDSGADVSVIGDNTYHKLRPKPELIQEQQQLMGAGGMQLTTLGKFQISMQHRGVQAQADVYVRPGQQKALLGRPEIENLSLISWIHETSKQKPEEEFDSMFEGLGLMEGEYKIKLRKDAVAYSVGTTRRVPIPLLKPTEIELKEMENQGIIERVNEPTEWCAPLVPRQKPGGGVRITVDFSRLNEFIIREKYQQSAVDECLAKIGPARVFSKIDANKSYFQIKLSEDSKHLTTFITPFGRYRFKRLPMGLSSSSEYYQARMSQLLEGLQGVVNLMDDCLVYGATIEEHDQNLRNVLLALKKGGITLNRKKCVFRTTKCRFLGGEVSAGGQLSPAEDKIKAILEMPKPRDITALQSFLGSVKYHLKFLENLSDVTKPLRDVIVSQDMSNWKEAQDAAFQKVKTMLTKAPVLTLYQASLPTRVTADASSYGLGACLEQEHCGGNGRKIWKPVYYASRSLTPTEQRFAQIEKEGLALKWACEKFRMYLCGLPRFTLRTDHKPLVVLFGKKPLSELSTRMQRFRLRMTEYAYKIEHVPGKEMRMADTLSRTPLPEALDCTEKEEETLVNSIAVEVLGEPWKNEVRAAQDADGTTQELRKLITDGWPRRPDKLGQEMRKFFEHRGELTISENLVVKDHRIFVPPSLRANILKKLHAGHLGVSKARSRCRETVWWPGISSDVKRHTEECRVCLEHRRNAPEPLLNASLPQRPWQEIGADFAEIRGKTYLIVVDYLSTYPEAIEVRSTGADKVIPHLKELFSRYGVPEKFRSDGGPPFNGKVFSDFAAEWGFQHIRSSPKYAPANGKAEAAVKKIKTILEKEHEFQKGLLAYRTASLDGGPSPAELLMGRKLRTDIPSLDDNLRPKWPSLKKYRERVLEKRRRTAETFNRAHRARELSKLRPQDKVWVTDKKKYGVVTTTATEPRSYWVDVEGRNLRRNRRFLIQGHDDVNNPEPSRSLQPDDPGIWDYTLALELGTTKPNEHNAVVLVTDPAQAPTLEADVPRIEPQNVEAAGVPCPESLTTAIQNRLQTIMGSARRPSVGRGRGNPNQDVNRRPRRNPHPVDRLNL